MKPITRTVLAIAAAFGLLSSAQSQDAEPLYVVTYLEVAPASADAAGELIRRHAAASRRGAGNLQFEALQRIGRANHFVLLEIWSNAAAQEAHANSAQTSEFRASLDPLRTAPYDERLHVALSIGLRREGGPHAVYGVTHVDIVPTFRDTGIALVQQLAEASRQDAGNLRFDALTQSSRTNHMTIVETWETAAAQMRHLQAPHKRLFREELLPLSGSLYDERWYRAIY